MNKIDPERNLIYVSVLGYKTTNVLFDKSSGWKATYDMSTLGPNFRSLVYNALYNTLSDNNLKYLFLDHRSLSTFSPPYKIVSNSLNKSNKIIPLVIFMINSK